MGNCCRGASRGSVWAGDDWECVDQHYKVMFDADDDADHDHENDCTADEGNRLLPADTPSSSSSREVKIKISRRELEELMSRAELGLSSEQVLVRLILSAGNNHDLQAELHHRHWKPALQSIPELD